MKNQLKHVIFVCIFLFFIVVVSILFVSQRTKNLLSDEEIRFEQLREKKYAIFSMWLPDTLTFAGEAVPLDNIFVREALEREVLAISYWHSRTLLILKRSYRYFPIFLEIFQQYGIHNDFCFLAMAESELDHVISPAGASGIWQLMKETARSLNLEVSDEVDERFHVEKSTHAACQYFLKLFHQFKSWTLAAAAYNMGPSRLPSIIDEQNTSNYYDLVLPSETMRYVYRILAFKIIWQSPKKYGFYLRYKDLYPPIPVTFVTVDTPIQNLSVFAQQLNISLKDLQKLNPWLRQNKLSNKSRKTYNIALPKTLSYRSIVTKIDNPYKLLNDTIGAD